MENYQKSISVENTPDQVYSLLTEKIADWWGDDLSGKASKQGDQFHIAFGNTRKTFEIIQAIPGQAITWLCRKAYIDMDTLVKKDEWVGTSIIWTIERTTTSSKLTMVHDGLNKDVECYGLCEPAWNHFIESIRLYLTTGTGTPYRKKRSTLEWEKPAPSA